MEQQEAVSAPRQSSSRWWQFSSDTLIGGLGVLLGLVGTVHSCYTSRQETSTALLNVLLQADRAFSATPPELSDAEGAITTLLALKPSHRLGLFLQGRLLEHQGQHHQAEEAYKRTLYQHPNTQVAHFYLGRLLTRTGRYAEGLSHLEKALTLKATPEEAIFVDEGELRLAIGEAYLGADTVEDRLKLAREACGKAAEHDSTRVRALLCVGDAHAKENNIAAAISYYEEAETLAPTDAVVLRKLGWGYRLMKRLEDARAKFEASLEIEQDPATEEQLEATRRELESQGG